MSKSLIITEKPSVARDIVESLGGFSEIDGYWESPDYVCTFAVGHLLELQDPEDIDPIYKRWTLDNLPIIPDEFKLRPKSNQTDRLKTIRKLVERKDVEVLVNACDAGREGELIFREIVKYLASPKPISRLWLQSMTQGAIREGFNDLSDGRDFEGLAQAAECRSLADWLIGINASRALTVRLRSRSQRGAWSAGRVQTPTLSLLVDREREILGHVPQTYWRVRAMFEAAAHSYEGTWFDPAFKADDAQPERKADRIFDEARALAIVAAVAGKRGQASEVRKPSREAAPPLFDLTSLQREANRRFSWTAARTLQAAQRCYETHKVLTYPRTSSRSLPNDYVGEVERVIDALAASPAFRESCRRLQTQGRQNDEKIFNDASVTDHFAIIPTGQISRSLQGDDIKLFDLVARRFLGAFHPPAVWEQVERTTVVESNHFSSRARTLREPGWRAVFDQQTAEDGEKPLPPLVPGSERAEGVPSATKEVAAVGDETKPPPRITEARLLSLMENAGKQVEDEDLAAALSEKGLGTPATRADIIENLKTKEYVDRGLRPTIKGMRFIDILERIHADRLTSAELTAELELHLGEVEHGRRRAADFMDEIKDYSKSVVSSVQNFDFSEIFPDKDPVGKCPLCGQPVYERSWFYRCPEPAEASEDDAGCPFRIWKDKSGRYIDRRTAETLLRDGKTGKLTGFQDRRGRTYDGILEIDRGEVVLRPIAGSEQEGTNEVVQFEVNEEPLGACPVCKTEGDLVVETPTEFVCRRRSAQMDAGERRPTGFYLPRMVCKREMKREEALQLMQTGATPLIEDFISRRGRPFKATLTLRESGSHQFVFPERAPRGGKKAAGKGDEGDESAREAPAKRARKASTKKAAVKKKTVKKKTAKKAPAREKEIA